MLNSHGHRRVIRVGLLFVFSLPVLFGGAKGIAPAPPADASSASPLKRIVALNPHLVDERVPNLSLKVHSLLRGPYHFFRGTADLFYVWCKANCADWLSASDTQVLLHGDMHPGNTGTYVAVPDGDARLAYSLVDFDEVFEGPFELDLLRAATSLRFAAAENGLSLTSDEWAQVVMALVSSYRAAWKDIDGTKTEGRREEILAANRRVTDTPLVTQLLAKANREDAAEYVDKYTKGHPPTRFKKHRSKKKKLKEVMLPVKSEERDAIVAAFEKAMRCDADSQHSTMASLDAKVIDVARWVKVGSSGSQGVRKYLVLLESPKAGESRPSIFQLKQEPTPGAARAGIAKLTQPLDRGRDVAEAYGRLQARPRRYVGWTRFEGRSYLVKPKDAFGKEPDTEDLADLDTMLEAARLMGGLLGVGHAKSRIETDVTKLKAAIIDDALVEQIETRSANCYEAFNRDYAALRNDARARKLSSMAERWLKAHE